MADVPIGANVGNAWVSLRFSAKGSKNDIQKELDSELGNGQSNGLGAEVGSKIGDDVSKGIGKNASLDPAAKSLTRDSSRLKSIWGNLGGDIGRKISASASKGFNLGGVVKDAEKSGDKVDNVFTKIRNSIIGGNGSNGGILGALSILGNGFAELLPDPKVLLALAAGAGALALALSPVVAAFIPITAGFGLLALLAKGPISQIFKAAGKGPVAILNLPKQLQGAAIGVAALKSQFAFLSKALQPKIMSDFSKALSVVEKLFPAFDPLARAAATAAGSFLGKLSNWLSSPAGQNFVDWLSKRGPADIKNFGNIVWSVASTVNNGFVKIVRAANATYHGIQVAMRFTKRAVSDLGSWLWDDFLKKTWTPLFDGTLSNAVNKGITATTNWFKSLPGRIGRALSGLKSQMFNTGNDALLALLRGAKSVLGTVTGFFASLGKSIVGALGKFLHFGSPSKTMFKLGKWIMEGLHNGIQARLSKFQGGLGRVTAGVKQWAGTVREALALNHLPASLTARVLYQMQTESGGNARAINLWDSNAAMGDPSRGLMQVIGSTFSAYHLPGTSNDIYNPLANIAAAIAYARARYGPNLESGGMGIGSGHGYDSGGIARGLGFMPKHTLKPERVLSPTQTSAFERLVDVLDGRSGGSRDIRITSAKLDIDMSKSEATLRDISAQEARSEIAFARR